MSDKPYISASICYGFIFRKILEYLTPFNVEGEFVFYDNGIAYNMIDDKKIIINDFFIKAKDIIKYEFDEHNARDRDRDGRRCYIVGVRLQNILSPIKISRKKTNINIIVTKCNDGKSKYILKMELSNQEEGKKGRTKAYKSIDKILTNSYEIDFNTTRPFAKVTSAQFSDEVKNGSQIKYSGKFSINVHKSGIQYIISENNGDMVYEGYSGDVDDNIIDTFTISAKYLKPFVNISNLSKDGIISFYYERNKPLKMSFSINNIGRGNVYISNDSELLDDDQEINDDSEDFDLNEDEEYE